jgi:hypothetical protein
MGGVQDEGMEQRFDTGKARTPDYQLITLTEGRTSVAGAWIQVALGGPSGQCGPFRRGPS